MLIICCLKCFVYGVIVSLYVTSSQTTNETNSYSIFCTRQYYCTICTTYISRLVSRNKIGIISWLIEEGKVLVRSNSQIILATHHFIDIYIKLGSISSSWALFSILHSTWTRLTLVVASPCSNFDTAPRRERKSLIDFLNAEKQSQNVFGQCDSLII